MEITNEELLKINQYSRKELAADDIYTFKVALCNNDIDRDYEKFSIDSLFRLAELFKGKTGIFDHSMRSGDQKSRIYDTYVQRVENKLTKDGEQFYELMAKAYMLNTAENKTLIDEIDAGIKNEVSVSCSMEERVCSICGNTRQSGKCNHIAGRKYDDKLCYFTLNNPTDAYEFSFVAVPAQPEAGTRKSKIIDDIIHKRIKDGREYRDFSKQLFIKAAEDEEKIAEGYATVFDTSYLLFRDDEENIVVTEEIARSAFDNCDMSDVIMQYDHQGRVFARSTNGTLELNVDEIGLATRAYLGGTDIGNQLYQEIDGGYTTKQSFGFRVAKNGDIINRIDHGDYIEYHRVITGIEKLYDVSAVSIPANDATSISARNFVDGVINEIKAERLRAQEKREKRQREHIKTQIEILLMLGD